MARSQFPRLRLLNRVQFALERLFVRGASFQLLLVAGLIGLISLAGGALVLPVAGEADHFGEVVWWAFLRLSDPGYLGDDEGAWRRIVSTVLTVAGYVVFLGALVAILTQWLNARMRRLESGLTPVATRNHIVVLGWSNRTLPIVGEILQSEGRVRRFLLRQHAGRLRLVVLCDEVTAWHAQALRDDPAIGPRGRHIVLRSGTPLALDDLERVDPLNAAAIIVPSASTGPTMSADIATIKALLSLSSHPAAAHRPLPYVVAEIQDSRKVPIARRAYRGPLEVVSGNSLISRLLAQNLRNAGLSRVYGELLSHQVGAGVFVREAGPAAGTSFLEAASRFRDAVLCGVVRTGDDGFEPLLNPAPEVEIGPDDRLVFVAHDYEHIVPQAKAAANVPGVSPIRHAGSDVGTRVRRVLILGWNSRVLALLAEFASYDDERFDVTIVSLISARSREAMCDGLGELASVSIRHLEADYVVEDVLRTLDPMSFDNVLLVSSERLNSEEEADARAVMAYLLLEALFEERVDETFEDTSEERDPAPRILLEIQDPDNALLLAGRPVEVMVSPKLLAHIVAQVALRRELRVVFDALLMSDGPEVMLRRVEAYPGVLDCADFGRAAYRIRLAGDTLVGLYHPASDELRLSPSAAEPLNLAAGDRLVVLTTAAA